MTLTTHFALRLAAHLEERGLSRKALARAAGLHTSTVSNLLDRGASPSLETAGQLARALGVPLAEMLGQEKSDRST